jgi:Family of unknown function (DUF6136)
MNEPNALRVVDGTVNPNYLALRIAHFRITLGSWFRGLDKALIALASALTFLLTAIVTMLIVGLAEGLSLLGDPATPAIGRLAVVLAWQSASFILLRALREAALMPRARGFFDALPVAPAGKLRADVMLAACSYSLLWLPVGWLIFDPLATSHTTPPVACLLELVVISLCVNIALLRGARWTALFSLAALLAFAGIAGNGIAAEFARLGCAILAAAALWRSYLPRRSRAARRARRSPRWESLALGSGLVIPLLASELRVNLLVRVGVSAATLGACLIVMQLRTNDASSASVVVFVAAVATLALHSLPALCRNTLLSKLQFLAGQPAFAQRMRLAAYGVPTALFIAILSCAWRFDHSGTAGRDALAFTVLYLFGVIGARLGWRITTWAMPFAVMIALIILSAMT